MCNKACVDFISKNISKKEITEKKIIEVGSYYVNGSVREEFIKYKPNEYIGVDILKGNGVDRVCDAGNLINVFGMNKFDILVSTELIEHVKDWRLVINNFKNVIKKNGIIFITTRSIGMGFHGYPYDYWRYEILDLKKIFKDFKIMIIQKDPSMPGVFIKAMKIKDTYSNSNNLDNINLYSILKKKRIKNVTNMDLFVFLIRDKLSKIIPTSFKRIIKKRLNIQ